MARKDHQPSSDEPVVTFELEEARQPSRPGWIGTAGATALTGVGMASIGAVWNMPDSLDVFNQPTGDDAHADSGGEIPVTSFSEIANSTIDPLFPPIDFGEPGQVQVDDAMTGSDTLHGASGTVGGGFTLEESDSETAFGVPEQEDDLVSGIFLDDVALHDGEIGDDLDPDDDVEPL